MAPDSDSTMPSPMTGLSFSPNSQAATSSVMAGFSVMITAPLPAGMYCMPDMNRTV